MNNLDALLKLRDDPALFVGRILKATPDEWQRKALEAVRDNDRLAFRSGHGVGKTTFLSWLILWFLFTRYDAVIRCTAPTSDQLTDQLWGEIRKWSSNMPDFMQQLLTINDRLIKIAGTPNRALAKTARRDQPEAFQGAHSKNLLLIADEASGIDESIFEAGKGALSTEGAKLVLTGNPTRLMGTFYNAFHRDRHIYFTMRVNCEDAKMVDNKFVKEIEDQYGRDSNMYRVRVLGEFPLVGSNSVIPKPWIESAVNREVAVLDHIPVVWGIDVARSGDDRNALAKRRGNQLIEIINWRSNDLMKTCGIIMNEFHDCDYQDRPNTICVDSIGLGAGVYDRLKEMELPVRAINVAESPSVKTKYDRLRDELWFKGRQWFEGRDCLIPADEEFIHELAVVGYEIKSTGKVKVDDKKKIKEELGESPDLADAFLLTFAVDAGAIARAASQNEYEDMLIENMLEDNDPYCGYG